MYCRFFVRSRGFALHVPYTELEFSYVYSGDVNKAYEQRIAEMKSAQFIFASIPTWTNKLGKEATHIQFYSFRTHKQLTISHIFRQILAFFPVGGTNVQIFIILWFDMCLIDHWQLYNDVLQLQKDVQCQRLKSNGFQNYLAFRNM